MNQKEQLINIEDFEGVNQQVDRENIGNYNSWNTQNLWEKQINILETRGNSNVFANGLPSNITGVDNIIRIFKNTLDHKRVWALQGLEQSYAGIGIPMSAMPSNVAVSWVTGGTDPIGNTSTWLTNVNADVGFTPMGMILRFIGYGFDDYFYISDATTISGYSAGTASRFRVAVTGALPYSNVTAIEVYAVVACGGATWNTNYSSIWCGSCDLIGTPTGNFDFYHAPLSKRSSSTSASGSNGALAMSYTISGTNVSGGTLLPGKTYYVAVLPHNLAWSATAGSCQNQYRQFGGGINQLGTPNITQITMLPGQNAINVNYPPSSASPISFNSMMVAVGEHWQLLIPCQISNVNPGTPNGQLIATVSSFPQNTPAVVDIEYLEEVNSLDVCNLRFRQSDFSTNDSLCKVNNDGTKVPIFIARQSAVNRYDNSIFGSPGTYNVLITSSGGSGPTIVVNPNLTLAPFFTDAIPINTPVVFTITSGGTMPGNLISGTTYYWAQQGNTGGVSSSPGGALIEYTSAGTNVQMTFSNFKAYQAVNIGDVSLYLGRRLAQPLIAQNYAFQTYQDLAFFVTGISNNPNQLGPDGLPNTPVSGTNLYVTDGNVAALVVFDYSPSPTPIPQGTVIGLYQESLCVTGGVELGDTVVFSNAVNPFNFEVTTIPGLNNQFQVEGLGEWNTGFSVFAYSMVYVSPQSFLVITKKNSTWIVQNLPFAGATNSDLVQLSKSIGCPQGRGLVQTPLGVMYPSVDNVYMVKDGGGPVPIADPISFILKQSDLSQCTASYHDEQYKLSFYSSLFPGTAGYNNVEYWLDLKKMKQSQGKPDWKGPMLGRNIDYEEIENLTGDGTVYNLTRDRVCVDRQNLRLFKADVLPAPTDTQVFDFGVAVTSILESKDYRVQEKDNNYNKLFTGTLWKVRTNCVAGSPLQATIQTFVEGIQTDSQTLNFTGLAATAFDIQKQTYTREFPSTRYRGRTVRKIFTTTQRVGIAGFRLEYTVEKRKLGT